MFTSKTFYQIQKYWKNAAFLEQAVFSQLFFQTKIRTCGGEGLKFDFIRTFKNIKKKKNLNCGFLIRYI